jgi:hypothetical protein
MGEGTKIDPFGSPRAVPDHLLLFQRLSECTYCSMPCSRLAKEHGFMEGHRRRLFVLLVSATYGWDGIWRPYWMILTGKDRSTGGKSHLLDTLSTSNITWSEFGSSLDLHGERQATDHLRFTWIT